MFTGGLLPPGHRVRVVEPCQADTRMITQPQDVLLSTPDAKSARLAHLVGRT